MASDSDEAKTKDKILDQPQSSSPPVRNAFTALMAPTRSAPPQISPARNSSSFVNSRMGLGAYVADPASFPPSVIIYQNADFVAIHDKFPKSTIHALLLPRSPAHNLLHPFEAFTDIVFLEKVQREVLRLRDLVGKELQRRLGVHSRSERRRQAVLDGDGDGELPQGRDWARDVICGVHARPSMSHLHVHVLSRDMRSEMMRHRRHYNSFTTGFLVDVADFPLNEGDVRLDPGTQQPLRSDLKCWRCGRGFGNQFKRLKEHLEDEFVEWRGE